jgi:hypothetical protein
MAKVLSGREMLLPADLLRPGVELVRSGRRKLRERQQDAVGDPRPEAGPIGILNLADEARSAACLDRPLQAESSQLLRE